MANALFPFFMRGDLDTFATLDTSALRRILGRLLIDLRSDVIVVFVKGDRVSATADVPRSPCTNPGNLDTPKAAEDLGFTFKASR